MKVILYKNHRVVIYDEDNMCLKEMFSLTWRNVNKLKEL